MASKRRRHAALLLLAALVASTASCGAPQRAPVASPAKDSASEPTGGASITLGDIAPDEPVKKIKRFQPLADYLAGQLGDLGISRGRVVIARDVEEMAA